MSTIRHGKIVPTCAALAAAALLVTLVLTHIGRAKPRPAPQPQAGTVVTDWAIRPGTYATGINIHNPSLSATVTLHKRAVVALSETAGTGSPPSAFQTPPYSLGPGYAVEVDCSDILGLLGSTLVLSTGFIKGYVTIVATGQLDAVGVYTAEPPVVPANSNPSYIPGIALEMLNIAPRIEFLGPATAVAVPGTVYEYSAKFLCGNSASSG